MLEQFKQKYLEEVTDRLNEMESALLELEHHPDLADGINKVFRVMHTIKGTCGMYGFKDVEKLTHKIENVYGIIRDNGKSVPKHLISITLEGVDIIRQLLNNPEQDHSQTLRPYTEKLSDFTDDDTPDDSLTPPTTSPAPSGIKATYHVVFKPEADISSRGVNLSNIIEELESIPGVVTYTHAYPDDEKYAAKFYMYWEAIFSTDRTYDDIKDIFLSPPTR